MVHPPHGRSCEPSRDPSDDIDLQAFADWITGDVIGWLGAGRRAIADAALTTARDDFGAADVRSQLSLIADRLHDLARELRSDRTAGSSAQRIELLTEAVVAECENGRRLIAQSARLLERHGRSATPTTPVPGGPTS